MDRVRCWISGVGFAVRGNGGDGPILVQQSRSAHGVHWAASQFDSWAPSAVCGAASTVTGLTSALTTVDLAFLTESSSFVSTPANPGVNQLGGGIWVRGVGGENTISSSGTQVPSV